MCKYSDDSGYKCPHENLEDNDYCIFHLQDDNKDVDEFNDHINELLETEEDSINLKGFFFPPGTTDFSTKIFEKKVNFRDATFSGEANFRDATFSGESNFRDATFSSEANFRDATFSSEANFLGATFSEQAVFFYAKFPEVVHFLYTTFSGVANFIGATISGKAYFVDAIFSGGGVANFMGAQISGNFVFIPVKSEIIIIIFKDTYFSDNVRIKADMSKSCFANSNIERVDMIDSIWIEDNKPKNSYLALIEWFKNKIGISGTSIIILEEQQGELSSNWKELEGIYRRLKQSYQKFGDTWTAGKFYYREMECKRKQLKGIEKHFWYLFYKSLCGYGEKPFNVIWASGLIIFASSLLFFYLSIELLGSEVLDVPPRLIDYNLSLNFMWAIRNSDLVIADWLECLYTSVITFTTLGYGDVHPIGFSRIVASVEAGLGIIMTALFIFVFSRKMLR